MRLVLTLGYQSIVFAAGANVAGILQALDGAKVCSTSGYGDSKKYELSSDQEIAATILPDAALSLPDTAQPDFLVAITKKQEENTALYGRLAMAQSELSAAKARLAEIDKAFAAATPVVAVTAPKEALLL